MPPLTYGGYTASPANANLDTLPQIPTVLGALPAATVAALTAFNVVPSVASAAARDALIPAPANDQRVTRKDTGYQERFNQALGRWVPEAPTHAAGPVRNPLAVGAYGDGAHDDTAAILAMDGLTGLIELDPGTYYLNTPGRIDLAGHWKPKRGAIFKLGANTTLNFLFPPEAGNYQIFDLSLVAPTGGYVTFSGRGCPVLNPYWWGVKGDATADDSQGNQAAWNAMPNGARIFYASGMQMKHKYFTMIGFKSNLVLEGDGFPGDSFFDSRLPAFIEDPTGPLVNRILVGVYCCGYPYFKGLSFQASGVALDIDGPQITSTTGQAAISISGPGYFVQGGGSPIFDLIKPGSVIAAGGVVTTIQTVTDATHCVLNANAAFTGLGGNNTGCAIQIGPGAQAVGTRSSTHSLCDRCTFMPTQTATGASFVGRRLSWVTGDNCDFNVAIDCCYLGVQQIYNVPQAGGATRGIFNVVNSRHLGGIIGYSSPGFSMAKNSNVLTVTNASFAATVEAFRTRVEACGPNATQGPNGTRSVLDGLYTHYISTTSLSLWTDSTMTTPVNASVNMGTAWSSVTAYVVGDVIRSGGNIYICIAGNTNQVPPNATFWAAYHEPHFVVGQMLGTGVLIGPSQNCHHNKEIRSQFIACGTGIDMRAGSFTAIDSWSSNCTLGININAANTSQLPIRVFNWNSENDEQHLFLLCGTAYSEENCRLYMSYVTPSDGYYRIVACSQVRLEEVRVEGQIPYDGAVFNYPGVVNLTKDVIRCQFFDAYSTAEMGWGNYTTWANGVVVYLTRNLWNNPDGVTLPLEDNMFLAGDASLSNNLPTMRLGNQVYVRVSSTAPSAAKLKGLEYTSYIRNHALVDQYKDDSGNLWTLQRLPAGAETIVDPGAGSFTLDLANYGTHILQPTASRSVNPVPSQYVPGAPVRIVVENAAAGAIVTTFHAGTFKLIGGWVDPAAGKRRSLWGYVDGGVFYEEGRSSGDL